MEMIEVIYKWNDGAFDIKYTIPTMVYKIDETYILNYEYKENDIEIDNITSITEEGIIIDMDDENYLPPIILTFENLRGVDMSDSSVEEFAKYLIKTRDANNKKDSV